VDCGPIVTTGGDVGVSETGIGEFVSGVSDGSGVRLGRTGVGVVGSAKGVRDGADVRVGRAGLVGIGVDDALGVQLGGGLVAVGVAVAAGACTIGVPSLVTVGAGEGNPGVVGSITDTAVGSGVAVDGVLSSPESPSHPASTAAIIPSTIPIVHRTFIP